jgi:hypothetical protein
MKPFNLEKALAGEPVVTRDGKPVTQLVMFEAIEEDGYVLYGVLNNKLLNFLDSGKYQKSITDDPKDLFMAEPEQWVNVYYNKEKGEGWVGLGSYASEKEAIERKNDFEGLVYYQATIQIKDSH